MKPVMFIQFMRPHGLPVPVFIDRPDDVADMAFTIARSGYRLEAEVLTTGDISFTIFDPKEEIDRAMEICQNGPEVIIAVDKLIEEFYEYAKANPID